MHKKIMRLILVIILGIFVIQCSNTPKKEVLNYTPEELEVYRESGAEIANTTKTALASVLIPTVNQKGTIEAIKYCNIEAVPLVDSISVATNRTVYRVSDKPRNPANNATNTELDYILEAKKKLSSGEKLTPKVFSISDKVIGYYPIITNQFCLQCHGTIGEQITEDTYSIIKQLYPNDEAIGYDEGQIRGILVVEMDGKN